MVPFRLVVVSGMPWRALLDCSGAMDPIKALHVEHQRAGAKSRSEPVAWSGVDFKPVYWNALVTAHQPPTAAMAAEHGMTTYRR